MELRPNNIKKTLYSLIEPSIFLFLIIGIFLTSYIPNIKSYLLFHSLAEIFRIVIGVSVFFIFWNTRRLIDNNYFVFVGTSLLFAAVLDVFHTLSYSGMNIYTNYDANLPTQLWIVARYIEAISFTIAIYCSNRKLRSRLVLFIFAVITTVIMILIFYGYFPDCYTDSQTIFKKVSEYVIAGIFLLDIIYLYFKRNLFKKNIFISQVLMLFFAFLAELSFSRYIGVFDLSNKIGHVLKLISYYLIYRSIASEGLKDPINLLFKNLKDQQQERMNLLIESLPEGVVLLDKDNKIIILNPAAERFLKVLTNDEVLTSLSFILDEPMSHFLEPTSKGSRYHEVEVEQDYNQIFQIMATELSSRDKIIIIRDVTTEKDLQEKAETRIRLTALGELAQGIVHDFNNVMSTILGATELANSLIEDDEPKNFLALIDRQAKKGSELIDQILDFTSKADVRAEKAELKSLVEEVIELYKTNIPESITLETKLKKSLVYVSKIQFQQIVMNLLLNAKDAVEKDGVIAITLKHVDEKVVKDYEKLEVKPGKYIQLQVKDNGVGMTRTTLSRAFEPFFTTKAKGKGSGLGLSQVYGITRQYQGYIDVRSKRGEGTIINIYFPEYDI